MKNVHAFRMDVWLARWLAAGSDERHERKEILKTMVSKTGGGGGSALQLKMVVLWNEIFLSFCENDMLRNENLGLKMGVSPVAHTYYH